MRLLGGLLMVAAIFLWFQKETYVGKYLSSKLGCELMLDKVQLVKEGLILKGVTLKNAKKGTAFECPHIEIKTSLAYIWKRALCIEKMSMQDPLLNLEFYNSSGTDNNWLHNLNALSENGHQMLMIQQLTLSNLRFKVETNRGKPPTISPIAYMEFENVGESKTLCLGKMVKLLFRSILEDVSAKPNMRNLLHKAPDISHEEEPFEELAHLRHEKLHLRFGRR